MRKIDFKYGEDMKKEILSRIFPDGYLKTREELFFQFYVGLFGLVPIKVTFAPSSVSLDPLGKENRTKKIYDEILCSVFKREDFDCKAERHVSYNEDFEVVIDFAKCGMDLLFNRKNKENAA